jgi:hypothetical protein
VNVTHIVTEWNPESEVSLVVAECGETGLVRPDGSVYPEGFDWFEPPYTMKATCKACVREYRARYAELFEAVHGVFKQVDEAKS